MTKSLDTEHKPKTGQKRDRTILAALIAAGATITAALITVYQPGFPDRYPRQSANANVVHHPVSRDSAHPPHSELQGKHHALSPKSNPGYNLIWHGVFSLDGTVRPLAFVAGFRLPFAVFSHSAPRPLPQLYRLHEHAL